MFYVEFSYRVAPRASIDSSNDDPMEPLNPGETRQTGLKVFPGEDNILGDFGITAIFRDRAGAWWSIWQDGRLEEIPEPSDRLVTPPASAAGR